MYSSNSRVASTPEAVLEKPAITACRWSTESFMSMVFARVGSNLFFATNKAVCFNSSGLILVPFIVTGPGGTAFAVVTTPLPESGACRLMCSSSSSVASMPIFSLLNPSITARRTSTDRVISMAFALLGSSLFLEMKMAQFRSSAAGPLPCWLVASWTRAGSTPFCPPTLATMPGSVKNFCSGNLGSGTEDSGGGAGAPASLLWASMRL
mmetsp:Transcript_66354/g.154179  ORF Transcript_66354/g.154179 Transcript_66354/m.154179 type:complete len:209 (-) Transcript_66354:239-865(-)